MSGRRRKSLNAHSGPGRKNFRIGPVKYHLLERIEMMVSFKCAMSTGLAM